MTSILGSQEQRFPIIVSSKGVGNEKGQVAKSRQQSKFKGNHSTQFDPLEPYLIAEPYEHKSYRAFTFQIVTPPHFEKSEFFDIPDAATFDLVTFLDETLDRHACLRASPLPSALRGMLTFYAEGGWDGPASFFCQGGRVGHTKGIIEPDALVDTLLWAEAPAGEIELGVDQQIKDINQIGDLAEFDQYMFEEWE